MWCEDFQIDFPCPECELKFPISLSQLLPDVVLVCPKCGAASPGGELSEINQAFKQLERVLKSLHMSTDEGHC